ncbi:MAG: hypothetical protein IT276_10030 [Ignavibacteriaceae bacterium]|nr:hypothetical protein [Ignavibacterium sp.]MCC6255245.1 hypothetical protein [Ignavibacteriaceae bacterium]HRN26114.1 hypothetical protein [Ignavibacteriaceae bacterium]HRP92592.1 hypothetical protein [Ignavibacteriaceae bacterium]HRQ53723.1 hypothetical protein [Ignavibacteriaceae bacterium]
MTKKSPHIKINYNKYLSYKKIAQSFFDAAIVSTEFNYYNAAGVLFVHSAIAYSDAITIKLSSAKSSGNNHMQIITFLDEILKESLEKSKALNHLRKIIDQKNLVSYSGDEYNKKDITQLQKYAERFQSWALNILNN